jgi:membrane protease YdiL (CAAX protease family)
VVEYLLIYVSGAIGIIATLVSVLIIYGLISALEISGGLANALEDISILLIYIMLMAGLPWFYLSQSLLIPGVYSLVMALCFWRASSRNSQLDLRGLIEYFWIKRANIKENCLIGLIGIPLGIIEYFILHPPPSAPHFDVLYFLQSAAYMLLFVALGEEILFRAMILRSLLEFMKPWASIFWSALIFAAMHTIWRSIPELIFVFAIGVLLGTIYYKTRNLVGPIIIHAINNVMLLAVMPYIA